MAWGLKQVLACTCMYKYNSGVWTKIFLWRSVKLNFDRNGGLKQISISNFMPFNYRFNQGWWEPWALPYFSVKEEPTTL